MKRGIIVFLVNGSASSAMGIRAQSFAQRLSGEFDVRIVYRSANKIYSILRNFAQLVRLQPSLCYVFDMGFSGVLAAGLYRVVSRCLVVVDTGDAIYELARSAGGRGRLGLWLTKWLEHYALSISDQVVVRSHSHRDLLGSEGIDAETIPDGVDLRQFSPAAENDLRRQYGLEGFVVVGILGSLIWNQRLEMCYGSELIEVIDRLRNLPVKGLVIGDGNGLARIRERCRALGIENRIVFAGRIPYAELPRYLNIMDICISTQTNDKVGQVRTSGKLPLYLACGRFVLATDVGEAARVLPPEMLVNFHGNKDPEYPARLAERIHTLLEHPEQLQQSEANVALARTHFDYDVLAARLGQTIRRLLAEKARNREAGIRLRPSPTAVKPRTGTGDDHETM